MLINYLTKKFKIVLLVILVYLFFPVTVLASEKHSFVTIVNPVRNRQLWGDISLLDKQISIIAQNNLASTWLVQYDVLGESELITRLKKIPKVEIGVFLEVSENLATDSETPYLLGDGSWSRADKVFFSGYEIDERKRMIDTLFEKFQKNFGAYPKSVGAWYLDSITLNYVVDKYKVVAAIDCSDQYSTDGYQIWGQPWGVPFYPSKFNSLIPAQTLRNKLPVVIVQWALRDPKLGYGRETADSTYSLQANDYLGHHNLNINYFNQLLDVYLKTDNQFSQATVGLEVGQEIAFLPEYANQLKIIANKINKQEIQALTLSEFAVWYRNKFHDLSPGYTIKSNNVSWYSSPQKRIGLDIINYDDEFVEKDLIWADNKKMLYRVVPSKVNFTGVRQLKRIVSKLVLKIKNLPKHSYNLPPLRFAKIDNTNIIGLQVNKTKLLAIKFPPFSVGVFTYPFQTLVRFRTWPKISILDHFFTSDSQLQLEEFIAMNKDKNLLVYQKQEIDVAMMEEFEKAGRKMLLDNSEYQVWQKQ